MVAVALALLPIFLVTLVPGGSGGSEATDVPDLDPLCLICGARGTADAVVNLTLFVPLGWVLARRWPAAAVLVAGVALSAGIELLQTALPGRYPTLGDVAWNGAGAWAGAALPGWALRRGWPLAAVGVAGLLAPVLLAPAPPPGLYYGQWTARFGTMEAYGGRVLEARVGSVEMGSGPSRQSSEVREMLMEGGPVEVRFVAGPRTSRPAPIFSIYDDERREMLMIAADGDDVVVRRWTLATSLGLDDPGLRWEGALRGVTAGDTVQARLFHRPRSTCFVSSGTLECGAGPGPGSAWTLLLSPGTPGSGILGGVSAAWAVGTGLLFGFLPLGARTFAAAALLTLLASAALTVVLPYLTWSWLQGGAFLLGAGVVYIISNRRVDR